MEKDKLLKIATFLIIAIGLTLLVKANVTFSKEPTFDENGNVANRVLEINSDLIKNIYSKLTLLNDSFLNTNYKYAYFKMNSDEKELSPEEKFYITVENLYETGMLETIKEDGVEKITVKADYIIDEANKLFKGDNIDAKSIHFAPMSKCGITDFLYTGTDYEFTFTICNDNTDITWNKLLSARKEGNYIILRIEAFYATYEESTKKGEEDYYIIKNYNSDDEIVKISPTNIEERISSISEDYQIYDYDFYFELRGDEYYLSKIAKVTSN